MYDILVDQLPIAYIGPGAGLGLLVSLLGLLAAIATALFTVVWWPIRKMLKRRKVAHGASQRGGAGGKR